MKWIKEKILNIWWKRRGFKKARLFHSYDVLRYGQIITVIHYHDKLIVITERSIWGITDNPHGIEAKLICE